MNAEKLDHCPACGACDETWLYDLQQCGHCDKIDATVPPVEPPPPKPPSRLDEALCIIALGVAMRAQQSAYFKARTPAALQKSFRLEREFDNRAKAILAPGVDLFSAKDPAS